MIEPCTPCDFPELIEVWERSVRETHHFLTEDYIQHLRPLILQNYFDAVRLFCIRNASGKISAFLGLSDDKVEMLFVDPVARGKGIGKLLMQYAIEEHKISKVDVNEQNEQAV
jgi:putative acetyltransferase